ncbi:carcinoembryonic antigen-related cell adhesion molecule 5-like, partial [Sigmodon hispidus]
MQVAILSPKIIIPMWGLFLFSLPGSHSLSCSHLSSSQLNIQAVPQYAAEGEVVLLQVHNLPEDLHSFSWYSSNSRTPLFTIRGNRDFNSISLRNEHRVRMMLYNNGSMMFPGVTEEDAGMYILEALKKDSKIEKAYVEFYVKNRRSQVNRNVRQPFVKITDTTVEGRRSVTFSCISPDTDISIHWIFNNQILKLTERMTLSPTQCGLRIDPVRSEDAGEYKCEVFNRFSLKVKTRVSFSWLK